MRRRTLHFGLAASLLTACVPGPAAFSKAGLAAKVDEYLEAPAKVRRFSGTILIARAGQGCLGRRAGSSSASRPPQPAEQSPTPRFLFSRTAQKRECAGQKRRSRQDNPAQEESHEGKSFDLQGPVPVHRQGDGKQHQQEQTEGPGRDQSDSYAVQRRTSVPADPP